MEGCWSAITLRGPPGRMTKLKEVVYTANPGGAWRGRFMDKSVAIVTIDSSWAGTQVAARIQRQLAGERKTVQSLYLPADIALPSVWEDEEPPIFDEVRGSRTRTFPDNVGLNIIIKVEAEDLHVQIFKLSGELVEDIRFPTDSDPKVRDVQQRMESQGWVQIEVLSGEGQHVAAWTPLQEYTSLTMKTCGKSEHRATYEAARHAAKQLNELSEAFRSAENQVVVLLEKHMPRGQLDVGIFGLHVGTPGHIWLESNAEAPLKSDVQELISKLGGQPCACFREIQNLAISRLQEVKLYVDRAFESSLCHQDDKDDFKVSISAQELVALIGSEHFHRLLVIFGSMPDDILIRRCQAHGQCINFHLDHSFKTLQVALNSDEEYIGGRLVFSTDSGLQVPLRSVGTVTLHHNDIVHGVTKLEKGIRYGLFFLDKTSKTHLIDSSRV